MYNQHNQQMHQCVESERLRRLEDYVTSIKEDVAFIKGRIAQKDSNATITSTVVSTIVASIISLFKP